MMIGGARWLSTGAADGRQWLKFAQNSDYTKTQKTAVQPRAEACRMKLRIIDLKIFMLMEAFEEVEKSGLLFAFV